MDAKQWPQGEGFWVMTEREALEKAQRLWGPYGAVYCFHETFFEVGVRTRLGYMVTFGMGDSWRTAFADAAKRGA
jgi:hypothetical protein